MLLELNELGKKLEAIAPDDFPPIGFAQAQIHFDFDLDYGIEERHTTPEKGKPKLGVKAIVPVIRRNGIAPLLFGDSIEYVLGNGPKNAAWLALLDRYERDTGDPDVAEIREAIAREFGAPEALPALLDSIKVPKPEGLRIRFVRDGLPLCNGTGFRAWWAKEFARSQDTSQGRCHLTGDLGPVALSKMPVAIKGLPNTGGAGAALTTFDKAASCSWGFARNENGPIAFDLAVRSHTALNCLIGSEHYRVRLGDVFYVFWGADGEGLNKDVWDQGDTLKPIFVSPFHPGLAIAQDSEKPFYLCRLVGNQGRIAVSEFAQVTPKTIATSFTRFRQGQRLHPSWEPMPLWRLRSAAFRTGAKPGETQAIDAALIRAALLGEPLPDRFAVLLIDRICAEGDLLLAPYEGKNGTVQPVRALALALYLSLLPGADPTLLARSLSIRTARAFFALEPLMNDPLDNPLDRLAFHLGRIANFMGRTQAAAQKSNLENSRAAGLMRSLANTPLLAFAQLYPSYLIHCAAQDSNTWIYTLKGKVDAEFLAAGLDPETIAQLPDVFDIRQQSLLMIGWATANADIAREVRESRDRKAAKAKAEAEPETEPQADNESPNQLTLA